jgi:hypothetical protein
MTILSKPVLILKLAVTVLLFAVLGSSCKSTKKIQAAIKKNDSTSVHITSQAELDSLAMIQSALQEVKSKMVDFKTFSGKLKVEYEDNKGKQPNITAYVRIVKDSIIWISGYATVFNIEAFRALITKDSVFVIDKINKEVSLRSIDYLQEVSEIPFDFTTLQDLLVGNPVFFSDSVVSYKETESKLLLSTMGKYFKHLLTISKTDRYITHSKLDDVDFNRNRTADITYGEYENTNGLNFSTYREVTVSEKNKLDIQLKYKQYEFNKQLQVSFNIPPNFKRR